MWNQLNSKSGEIQERAKPTPRKLIARELTVHRNGQPIVHVESLDIYENSVSVFVGENGSGKSTLLSAFGLRLRTEFSGGLWIDGIDAGRRTSENSLAELRRGIGQSPQRSPVQLDQSVDQNLAFAAVLRGASGKTVHESVRNTRHQFDLPGSVRASSLNGGRRALLSLAMSFCGLPDRSLIIADEPTAALSVETAAQLHTSLEFLQEKFGHTLLIVSHDMHWLSRFKNAAWYRILQGVLRSTESPFRECRPGNGDRVSDEELPENKTRRSAQTQRLQQERKKPSEIPINVSAENSKSKTVLTVMEGEDYWRDGQLLSDPRFRL